MSEYFAAIGLNLSEKFATNELSSFKIYTAASLQSSMVLDIVENEVACAIDSIKTNFALGPDGISLKFIKMANVVLVPVLTKLYNKCLKEECFSDDFELIHVISIPKNSCTQTTGRFPACIFFRIYPQKYLKKC